AYPPRPHRTPHTHSDDPSLLRAHTPSYDLRSGEETESESIYSRPAPPHPHMPPQVTTPQATTVPPSPPHHHLANQNQKET
ncbi:hypothetical protein DXG01_007054, partial [Tephrocybe rancida]